MNARTGITALACVAGLSAAFAFGCTRETGEQEDLGEEALVEGAVPRLGTRIDRIGRPEVTNFLVRNPVVKEAYNADDSFAVGAENLAKYIGLFKTSLAMYDGYDATVDMDDEAIAKLATILADDTLRIDLGKPCAGVSSTGYLDIERGELTGTESPTCGGRSPNEDAFDTLATLYTNGPTKLTPRVGDLVDTSTGVAGEAFPYLVKPHLLRAPMPTAPAPTSPTTPAP